MTLSSLQERNESLFYRTVIDHLDEIMPLIYTPTVGEACREFSHIAREPKGFFITPDDRGRIAKILDNWPEKDIRVIVVTDGQRILGLGDLGANGMGIPIGKLALYTACAGIPPKHCLPVMLDVGTNNAALLEDVALPRVTRASAWKASRVLRRSSKSSCGRCRRSTRGALIQFEDFLTPECVRAAEQLPRSRALLQRRHPGHRRRGAGRRLRVHAYHRTSSSADLRIMFLGAGSAATGIADLMVSALVDEGLSLDEARRRLWFVDVNGLVVKGRTDLMPHNLPYAHEHPPLGFVEAIDALKPHVLIGATGAPGTFTQQAVERMCAHNERPVLFALSNPTSKAECTAEQAYSVEPRPSRLRERQSLWHRDVRRARSSSPGQGNNAYVFPGIGLGAVVCRARVIPDEFFLTAARTLAGLVEKTGSRARLALSAAAGHPPDLARHRGQRGREGLRTRTRAGETAEEFERRH